MEQIILKRHFLKFYGSLSLFLLVAIGLGTALFVEFVHGFEEGDWTIKTVLGLPGSILCGFVIFYTPRKYFRSAPIITIDRERIYFPGKTYNWSDLSRIELRGRTQFELLLTSTAAGAAELSFKDGTTHFIYDDFYVKPWEWKMFVQKMVLEKQSYWQVEEARRVSYTFTTEDHFQTYSNHYFTSVIGIMLTLTTVMFTATIVTSDHPAPVWFIYAFSLMGLCAYAYCGTLVHYFQVGSEYVVIRNHIFFWKRRYFKLADIAEVSIDSLHNHPNFLKFSTRNFKTHRYFAGTLRDKTWLALKDRLEERGVKVRDYVISPH